MSKSGEHYKSKKAKERHERTESKSDRMKEYGPKMKGNGCQNRKNCS